MKKKQPKPKFTARQIAGSIKRDRVLDALGVKPIHYKESPDEDTDGHVQVTKKIHVQVGWDYLNVVYEQSDTLVFRPTRFQIKEAMRDLRMLFTTMN